MPPGPASSRPSRPPGVPPTVLSAPQNDLTLPSLLHVRPPPLPGCPPRQRRPGLHHYLPAQRGVLSQADPAVCIRGEHLTFTTPAALIDWECLPAAGRNHLALSAWTGRRLDKRWTSRLPPGRGAHLGSALSGGPALGPLSRPSVRALPPSLGGLIVLTPKGRGQRRIESDLG